MSSGKLLVVMRVCDGWYEVCGPWELGIADRDITLVERIQKPDGFDDLPLYYGTGG